VGTAAIVRWSSGARSLTLIPDITIAHRRSSSAGVHGLAKKRGRITDDHDRLVCDCDFGGSKTRR